MGKTNTELLKIAEKHLGEGGARYRRFCGLPSSAAWCNAFVDTIAAEGSDAKLYFNGRKETYCPHSIKWCYNNLASIPPYLAMPMDIIYFDWEKNGVPNHIGFVRKRKDCEVIYTVEGNTSGGIVANRTRNVKYVQAIFRPHFVPKFEDKELKIDGKFEYNSIAMLQKALMMKQTGILDKSTVKTLQRIAGTTADGDWGVKTSKAVQKMVGAKVDGYFGEESVKKLQKWINRQNSTLIVKPKPVNKATLIGETANKLAYKTNTKKANYPKGQPTEAFKKALNEVYPNHNDWGKAPSKGASCDVFVGTCVRCAGVDKKFPRGLDDQMKYLAKSDKFKLIKEGRGKDGDIIVYSGSSGGHICIAYGGKIKEAGYQHYYGKTTNTLKTRLSTKNKKWVKVYRAIN